MEHPDIIQNYQNALAALQANHFTTALYLLNLIPENVSLPNLHCSKARCLIALGRFGEAEDALRTELKFYPNTTSHRLLESVICESHATAQPTFSHSPSSHALAQIESALYLLESGNPAAALDQTEAVGRSYSFPGLHSLRANPLVGILRSSCEYILRFFLFLDLLY